MMLQTLKLYDFDYLLTPIAYSKSVLALRIGLGDHREMNSADHRQSFDNQE